MLYIVTALKPEAQAFVDYHKLKKSKLNTFTIFQNENIKLIISGIGVEKSRLATQTLINHFDITDDDIYLNAGICGASKEHKIGKLLEIGSLEYNKISYKTGDFTHHLTCMDEPSTTELYRLVDMESYGFYDAVIHNPAIKKFYILKVVSDHFEPQKVTKEGTKSLLFNVIDDINTLINF
ncbi:hypothetical protein [Sulfurimonas sp.]